MGEDLSNKISVDLTIALRIRYHLQSVLSTFEPFRSNACPGFVFKHSVDPRTNSHRLIILHELDSKYSHLMVGFLKATFETFGMRTVEECGNDNLRKQELPLAQCWVGSWKYDCPPRQFSRS